MRRTGRITGLLLIGLLAYVLFLLAGMPAALAWQWGGQRLAPQVRAYGIAGTVWDGQAEAIVSGPRRVDNVRWDIRPSALLKGRLGARLVAAFPDGRAQAVVEASPGGTVTAEDVKADMDIDSLLALAGRQGLSGAADGHFEALFQSLVASGGRLRTAQGVLNWNGARVGLGQKISLGDLALRIRPAGDNGVRGELVSSGGAFALEGDAALRRDGGYQVELRITPRNPSDPATAQAVRVLGLANPRGTTVVNISGSLAGGTPRIQQHGG
jgi:general secretion pathway protein N